MSNDTKLYYDKWSSALQVAHQTRDDVYAGLTDTRSMESNRFFWKITGTVEMASLNTEDQEINHQSRDYEERQLQAAPAFLALKWQKGELLRAHANVKADWIRASIFAMNRWNAAVKRNAFTGDAIAQYEGETTSTTKTLSGFSSDQVIAHGSTGLDEAKVKAVRSNFVKKKSLMAGEKIYLAISQEEMDDLTAIERFRNNDYYDKGAAETGMITKPVYGVHLVHDEDLNVSANVRTCIAWVKSGLMFGEQASVFTRQDELQTRHYMDQFYLRVDNGATRTREDKVMSVLTYHS